ncbi:MAG: bacillithiol biosynthesis deacetylase BshB1 [Bacteroidota bacterium]|jgi:bacillithiol biosynthesis deacetylase BshB1
MKLDILAFGVHPDDVELGCAGSLIIAVSEGKKVGVVDLTQGELGTRGTVHTRKEEADAAAKIIGLAVRENLNMRDGFFVNDEQHQLKIISCIRKYRPDIVICNAPEDRHPDHGRASRLVVESCFYAGLSKIKTQHNELEQDPWRPKNVFHYLQDRFLQPDFLVDISKVFDKKLNAIKAYSTQFYNPDISGPETYISTPEFLDTLIGRYKLLGKTIGVAYAEGFITQKTVGLRSLSDIIHMVT